MSSNKHVAEFLQGPIAIKGPLILQGLEFEPVTLEAVAGTVAVDLTRASMMTLTLDAATTISNPTGKRVGTQFLIVITQDPATPRAISWGTDYEWGPDGAPAFEDGAVSSVSVVRGVVVSSTKVLLDLVAGDDAASVGGVSADSLDGSHVAPYDGADLTPGVVIHFTIPVPDAVGNVDRVVAEDFEIIDVWAQKRGGAGGAGGSITVKKGASTIGVIAVTTADKTLTHIADIDDTQSTFAAGNTLRLTSAQGAGPTNVECLVHVLAIKR